MFIPKIREITLLSLQEARAIKVTNQQLLKAYESYWIRSRGFNKEFVSYVTYNGYLRHDMPFGRLNAVRPVLKINNLKDCTSNNFEFAGHIWTIFNEDSALMDNILCDNLGVSYLVQFNKDASKGNDFNNSDIEEFLNDFLYNKIFSLDTLIENNVPFKTINKILNNPQIIDEQKER